MKMMSRGMDVNPLLQLYITTKEKKYGDKFLEKIWPLLDQLLDTIGSNLKIFPGFGGKGAINPAIIAIPYLTPASSFAATLARSPVGPHYEVRNGVPIRSRS